MAGSLCITFDTWIGVKIGRPKVCLLASTRCRIDGGENSNSRKLFVLALEESREEKVNWKKSAEKKDAGSPHSEGKKLDEKNREIEKIFGLKNELVVNRARRTCTWLPPLNGYPLDETGIGSKYPKYLKIPETKRDTRKYPIAYFDTPTRPEPDPIPGILSNTRPDPTRY